MGVTEKVQLALALAKVENWHKKIDKMKLASLLRKEIFLFIFICSVDLARLIAQICYARFIQRNVNIRMTVPVTC